MTSSRLRRRERCPLHNSFFCCGRERPKKKPTLFRGKIRAKNTGPVIRVIDDHHPRGYRELCSKPELRRRKNELIRKPERCFYCGYHFEDYRVIELAHKQSMGMGGSWRDDHRENLALAHRWCNRKNGSKSVA